MSFQLSLQEALGLTEQETTLALKCFSKTTLAKNTIIQTAGKDCTTLYFLEEGYIRIFAHHDAKEITQWVCTPNYFVTDIGAWLFGKKAKWNMEALSECTVYSIDLNDYNNLANQIPLWHQKEKLFIGHCFEQMELRIYNFIALDSFERYTAFSNQFGFLFNIVPHQYIASILGITPETLSRLRKKSLLK